MELTDFSMPETTVRKPKQGFTNRRSTYTRLMSSGRGSWKKRNPSTSSAKRKSETRCPIHEAVRKGNVEELMRLINAADSETVNVLNDEGMTALHIAAKFYSKEIISYLLENGANVDMKTSGDSSTALHYAVRYHNVEGANILLNNGANAGLTDVNGSSALHFAASRGLVSLVERMLDTGIVSIDICDMKYNTPLHRAARGCEIETCKVLVNRGASLEASNTLGETPLHLAAEEDNVEVVELFLKCKFQSIKEKEANDDAELSLKSYIDKPRSDMKTALHIASLMGHTDVIRFLISKGADVSALTSQRSTAVHLAASHGNIGALELLIKAANGVVDFKDCKGQIPLHKAAVAGHKDAMKVLLDQGSDINSRDNKGSTPLLYAVKNDHIDATTLLLERKAKTLTKDENLRNALHFACENGSYSIVSMLLGSNKRLIHSRDNQNMTALHYAAIYGHSKILKLLMSKTMQWLDADSSGQTPLHLAAKNGHALCVILLASQSDNSMLNFLNANGQTPLHVAVIHGQLEASRMLVKYGADVNYTDKATWTPLHYASTQEHSMVINGLLQCEDIDIDMEDENGNTPLMVAAEAGRHAVVTSLMDADAALDCVNKNGANFFDIAIEFQRQKVCEAILKHERWQEALAIKLDNKCYYMNKLIEKYPDIAEIALDRSCSFTDHTSDHPDFSVTFDYGFLEEYPEAPKKFSDSAAAFFKDRGKFFFAPSTMGKYGRQTLISHPIIKSLFTLKWQNFGRYLYYLSFFMYMIFVVSLNVSVILESQSYVFLRVKELNANSSSRAWRKSLETLMLERPSTRQFGKALGWIVLGFCCVQMLGALIQLLVLRYRYFLNPINYIEVTLYVTSIYFIVTFLFRSKLTKVTYEIGVVCTFVAWVNVMFYLQRVPMCRVYIVMFIQVFMSIVKVIIVFAVIILAFVLTFYMLFIRQTSFIELGISFAKVIVMMTGEFDYDTILTGNLNKRDSTKYPLVPFPVISYIVFIGFVFLISLAFANLLIGLAVGDIENIREIATLTIQKQQLDFINSIQGIVPIALIRRFMSVGSHTEYLNKKTRMERLLEAVTSDTSNKELMKLRMKLIDFEGGINASQTEEPFNKAAANV